MAKKTIGLRLTTTKKLLRRNCLKHFNGRRDRLAKMPHLNAHPCHDPEGAALRLSDCKEVTAGATCAIDALTAGILLAHFPEIWPELEHFETVQVVAVTQTQ